MQIRSYQDLLSVEEILEIHEIHGKFDLLLKDSCQGSKSTQGYSRK